MELTGIVAAMPREAASVRGAARRSAGRVVVDVSGVGMRRAREAALRLVARGATALMSWGTAGALDPTLAAGTLVLYTRTHAEETEFAIDPAWRRHLDARLAPLSPVHAAGYTSPRPVIGAEDKRALLGRNACVAVDMESAAVAAVAAEHGLPFAAVRCVADEADLGLPSVVLDAFDAATGEPRALRVLTGLVRRPDDAAAVLRLARAYAVALARLRTAARLLGADLAAAGYTARP